MMSKELSMTKLDEVMKSIRSESSRTLAYKTDKGDVEIDVKYTISLDDMCALVVDTVSNLFKENGAGEIVYCPELYDVSLAANVLEHYTNLKSDLGNDRLVELVYSTNILTDIESKISATQYCKILDYVEQRTRFICEAIHAEQASKLSAIATKIDNAAAAFNTIQEQLAALGDDRLQKLADSVISLTPDVLAGAIVQTKDVT